MSILSILFKRKKSTEIEILNTGLKLLLKLSFDVNQSMQGKLLSKYPYLTVKNLNDYAQKCKDVKAYGHDLVYERMIMRLKSYDPITKSELKEMYRSEMTSKFTWVDKSNFRRIYNLECYGLEHDGWWQFKHK